MKQARIIFLFSFVALVNSSFAQKHLRLMTYNIRNAKGMDNNTDYDRIATVINNADADIIALQELDSVTKRNNVYLLDLLSGKTGMKGVFGAAIQFQGGKYGVGILSKKRPLKYYTVPLPGKEEERVLLVAIFKKYVIFCTHLSLTEADRNQSINIINNEAVKFNKPVYLLGDLNAEPASQAIALLKQKWRLLSGEEVTFPAGTPIKCIDYIFTTRPIEKIKVTSKVINEPMASDHRPILVEINTKRSGK
jgi:endonuclease/exonuclease/phosphatase family metal-dependent hydrolase